MAQCHNFINADLIVEASISRVAERVAHGSHNIPEASIRRRYPRSITNLLDHYAPLCSETVCLDNAKSVPKAIFTQNKHGRIVKDQALYQSLCRGIGNG